MNILNSNSKIKCSNVSSMGVYYGFKEKRAEKIPLPNTIFGFFSTIGWYNIKVQGNINIDGKKEKMVKLSEKV